jgi:hypothetical protein
MTIEVEADDPFAEHYKRDSLPGAGIRIIWLTEQAPDHAPAIIGPLCAAIAELGRTFEQRVVALNGIGLAEALEDGLSGTTLPLVLVTTATEPWTKAHLEPLLEAIDVCDHVIGRRAAGPASSWVARLRAIARHLVFAVPVVDVHSPCRLHRLEKLTAFPLQSASSFLDVEILAKATFLGHLLDEVAVPRLEGATRRRGYWSDLWLVFKQPQFARESGPSEELESQDESGGGPAGEDGDGPAHLIGARTLEDNLAQPSNQLRERQGLDQGLEKRGEPFG